MRRCWVQPLRNTSCKTRRCRRRWHLSGPAPSSRQLLGDCRSDDRAIGKPIYGHLRYLRYLRLGDANSVLEPQMAQSDAD
jgi:hypothetical protein